MPPAYEFANCLGGWVAAEARQAQRPGLGHGLGQGARLEQGHLCAEAYQEEVIKLCRNSAGPRQRCLGKCYLWGDAQVNTFPVEMFWDFWGKFCQGNL